MYLELKNNHLNNPLHEGIIFYPSHVTLLYGIAIKQKTVISTPGLPLDCPEKMKFLNIQSVFCVLSVSGRWVTNADTLIPHYVLK